MFVTARKRSNIFTSVCHSVHRGRACQGGRAWQGACVAGGHAWQGGIHDGGHV